MTVGELGEDIVGELGEDIVRLLCFVEKKNGLPLFPFGSTKFFVKEFFEKFYCKIPWFQMENHVESLPFQCPNRGS